MLLALALIISYAAMGMILGRISFVRSLGEKPREEFKWEYANLSDPDDFSKVKVFYKSEALKQATNQAIWTIIVWPILFPFLFMIQAPTPYERLQEKKQEEKELAQRFKELERDVMQFGESL